MAGFDLVVQSASDTPEGRGRMVHALKTAQELQASGADVGLYFHGIGVTWLAAFATRTDQFTENYGPLFDGVLRTIAGACDFCAAVRFDVAEAAESLGVALLGGTGEHHTVAQLLSQGRQVVTF